MENKVRAEITNNPPYEALRLAIVAVAVEDYNTALANGKEWEIKKLERFFLSTWGQTLCDNHGKYIIDRCRKEKLPKPSKPKRTVKITPIEKES